MTAALLLLAPLAAFAAGYSTDIELVRPGFGPDSLPGIDSPRVAESGAIYAGLLGQLERDPLVLYEYGNEVGPIVGQRTAAHLGVVWTPIDVVSVRAVLPGYVQGSGDIPELAANGAGLGDLGVAGIFRALEAGPVALGLRTELIFPTGRDQAYMAEDDVRTSGALLAHFEQGRFDALLDGGVMLRTAVEAEEDWDLGGELAIGAGVRYHLFPGRLALYGLTLNRTPLTSPWSGGAASPAETILGVQGYPITDLRVDVGIGKGWTAGYGTTQQRFLVQATWRIPERKPPAPSISIVEVEEPPAPDAPPEPDVVLEDEPWAEGELARVVGEKIEIRDPIQFEFATANILPESIPTLRYVSSLLAANDRIGHVVVEGHASEEGSYEYNYDLSVRRSQAIWEQLVLAGTHPSRVSYRGMGEVVPILGGQDEAALARNRRAEFHIIYQLDPLTPAPRLAPLAQLPWNGTANEAKEQVTLVAPKVEAPKYERLDVGAFDDADHSDDAPDTLPDRPQQDDGDESFDGTPAPVETPTAPPAPDPLQVPAGGKEGSP